MVTIKVEDLNNDSLYGIYHLFIMVTAGHTWSHMVTLVTGKVRNINNDGLDDYYGSLASHWELLMNLMTPAPLNKHRIFFGAS